MFNIQFKRWGCVGLIVAVWLAVDPFSAAAQKDMTGYRRNFTRSHMFSSFSNNSLFGASWGVWGEGMYFRGRLSRYGQV